jgi:hypothetical protein
MTTKADVIAAIVAVEARVERLAPDILAHADARLPEGEWRVREALCHLAARSNSVPMARAAVERARTAQAQGGPALRQGSFDIDEVNRQQIADRQGRSPRDLLDEIHQGHQAEIAAMTAFDPEMLDLRIPSFTGQGDMSVADLLLLAGPGHDNAHLDQIEGVLAH